MSYVSSCSFGFIGRVSAAVAIAVRDRSKIDKALADIVENFIRWMWLEHEVVKRARFLISDSSSRIAALARFP